MSKGHLKKAFEKLDGADHLLSKNRVQSQIIFENKNKRKLADEVLKAHRAGDEKRLCELVSIRKSLLFHPLIETHIKEAIEREAWTGASKFLKLLSKAIQTPPRKRGKSHLTPLNNYLFEEELLDFNFESDADVTTMRKKLVRAFDEKYENHPLVVLINDPNRFCEHLVRCGLRRRKRSHNRKTSAQK